MSGRRRRVPATQHVIPLSLEELYQGLTKKLKITRQRIVNGQPQQESKILEIAVKPGWKAGTKITFDKEGDEEPGVVPADVVFVIEEKKHPVFTRKGNDLVVRRNISLTDALCGAKFTIEGIDKTSVNIDTSDAIVRPGYEKVIAGKGMPISKRPGTFGNMIVQFEEGREAFKTTVLDSRRLHHIHVQVDYPRRTLNEQQKRLIREANLS